MLKSLCFSFALVLGCVTSGCASKLSDHGDLSGLGGDVDMGFDPLGATDDMAFTLVIAPLDSVVTATPGQMPTVQYSATVDGASVAPSWTIDRGEIGVIDVASGLFTASGTLAGKANITAS